MSQSSEYLNKEIEHQQNLQRSYQQNLRYIEEQISTFAGIAPINLLRQRDLVTDELNKIARKIQELEQQKQASTPTNTYTPQSNSPSTNTTPTINTGGIKIYTIYADEDKIHKQRLDTQLASYKRSGMMDLWDKDRIYATTELTQQKINNYIDTAQIILLLVSPNFSASEECATEMDRAMLRRKDHKTIVIPIYIRPTDWPAAPFEGLLSLPRDKRPVTSWPKADEAWYSVAVDIRRACDGLRTP